MATAFPEDSLVLEQSPEDEAPRPKRKSTPKNYGEDNDTGKLPKKMDNSDKPITRTAAWLKQKVLTPIKNRITRSQSQHSVVIDDSTSPTPGIPQECLPKNTSTPIHDNLPKTEGQDCNESFHSLDDTLLPKAESPPPQHNQKTKAIHGQETSPQPSQPPIERPRSTPDNNQQHPPERPVQEEPFFQDKSLNELLPGGSQPSPTRSAVASFKTLVTDSFIDNLPRTDPAQTITKLNSLLLVAQQDLQKTKHTNESLMNEMNNKQPEHALTLADLERTRAQLNKLKDDITQLRQETKPPHTPIHYFRGWKNTLSTHHPCVLKIGENYFRTQEHAYCYKKLMHHHKSDEAEVMKKKRFAGQAKTYTHSIVPNPSKEWQSGKGQVMHDLTVERVRQSKKFRDALHATGSKHLVHNMENDSCWGFGEDGEGINLMGVTLEKARDSLAAGEIQYTQDNPTAATALQESQTEELDIIIISDSMLAGVNQYMEGRKADLHVLSGATTSKVHQSLGNILKNRKPRAVVIHCGTNDLEDSSLTVIQETYQHIVDEILFLTGGTTIIMSGMIHRLDKPQLNERMNTINDFLQSLQTETVRYVNHNPTFFNLHRILNQGGLHLRLPGIRQVASNLTLSLAGQSPTANAQAWTTKPPAQSSSQTNKQQHQAWSRPTRPAPHTPKSQKWS